MSKISLPAGLAATVAAAALALSACSPAEEAPSENKSVDTATHAQSAPKTTTAQADAQAAVTLDRGVVRSKGTDSDMTAIFGTLTNHTDKDIVVKSVASPTLGPATYQLHETVDGVMREKTDGFLVPANGEYELAPGGDHIMIMDYDHPLASGDTLTLTLNTDAGDIDAPDLPVRVISAGEENYGDLEHGDSHEGHHDMSGEQAGHHH